MMVSKISVTISSAFAFVTPCFSATMLARSDLVKGFVLELDAAEDVVGGWRLVGVGAAVQYLCRILADLTSRDGDIVNLLSPRFYLA
jgi:hypothetical protein